MEFDVMQGPQMVEEFSRRGIVQRPATFGCGNSDRFKGDSWTSDGDSNESYFNQSRVCYPDYRGENERKRDSRPAFKNPDKL